MPRSIFRVLFAVLALNAASLWADPIEPILALDLGETKRAYLYPVGEDRAVLLYLPDPNTSAGSFLFTDYLFQQHGSVIFGTNPLLGAGDININGLHFDGTRPDSDWQIVQLSPGKKAKVKVLKRWDKLSEFQDEIGKAVFPDYSFLRRIHGHSNGGETTDTFQSMFFEVTEMISIFPRSFKRAFVFAYLADQLDDAFGEPPFLFPDGEFEFLNDRTFRVKTELLSTRRDKTKRVAEFVLTESSRHGPVTSLQHITVEKTMVGGRATSFDDFPNLQGIPDHMSLCSGEVKKQSDL